MDIRQVISRLVWTLGEAKDCAFVAILPGLLPFSVFHAAVRVLPLWGQIAVATVLAVALAFLLRYLVGSKLESFIRPYLVHRFMVWFPPAASIGTLVFAMYVFAAVHSMLLAVGLASLSPSVDANNWARISDLYLWHFMSAVPGLKIPETLKWSVPYQYTDRVTGGLILLFQVTVIAPVIKIFYVWLKLRGEIGSPRPRRAASSMLAGDGLSPRLMHNVRLPLTSSHPWWTPNIDPLGTR